MDRCPDLLKTGVLKSMGVFLFLWFAASALNFHNAHAYQLLDLKWPDPSTTFHVDIPGANGLWDEAFEGAMYEWTSATVFQYYIVRGSYSDPCDPDDERNGVRFHDTNCGDAWGSTTLAVCNYWYVGSTLVEADIVFNSDKDWNVYWTPWSDDVADFRRVAVHELGHALGLTHEDSGVPSIMATYAGDITTPQKDDIAGVAAIYGLPECTFSIAPSGGSFPSGGGTKTVSVTASDSSCSWTVSHSLSWANVSLSGGTGSRNVTVTAAANSGAARSGTLTIAGRTYTISQDAVPCTFDITPSGGFFPSGLGMNTVSVTASSSSCSWTVSHSLSWVNVSPSGGTGSRNVTVTAAANSGAARSGTLTIAGRTYTISQAAENDAPVSVYIKKVVDLFSHVLFKFCFKIISSSTAGN
jgi:hypothetical protein